MMIWLNYLFYSRFDSKNLDWLYSPYSEGARGGSVPFRRNPIRRNANPNPNPKP